MRRRKAKIVLQATTEEIDARIARVGKAMSVENPIALLVAKPEKKKRRRVSKAGRARMSAAQKARYAAARKNTKE